MIDFLLLKLTKKVKIELIRDESTLFNIVAWMARRQLLLLGLAVTAGYAYICMLYDY